MRRFGYVFSLLGNSVSKTYSSTIVFYLGSFSGLMSFSLFPFHEFAHLLSFGITSHHRIHYIHSHVSLLYGFNHTVNLRRFLCSHLRLTHVFFHEFPTSYFTSHSRHTTRIPHVNITSPTNGFRHVDTDDYLIFFHTPTLKTKSQ
jgi:hypothetical protein